MVAKVLFWFEYEKGLFRGKSYLVMTTIEIKYVTIFLCGNIYW